MLSGYTSYALFTDTIISNNVINLKVGKKRYYEENTLNYTIEDQVKKTAISYKYINNENVTKDGITYNNNDNGIFLFNGTDDNGGDKPIYYYRGNVTNNNVLFANMCWKIVRTTSTGGTKLIYNGVPFDEYESYDKLNESSYVVTTNTPTTYPFTFDSSTKEWSSGIAGIWLTNTIEFTVTEPGDYVLNYTVGSKIADKASFYKNGTALASNISGAKQKGTLDLTGLTTSDVIKVTYKKDSSYGSHGDKVSFSIAKPIGEKTLSCNNTGAASQLSSTSAFNATSSYYCSPSDVGYMYGARYTYTRKSMSSVTDTYKYGNDVTYSNGTYTLSGKTMNSTSWSTDRTTIADGYHYTCLNSTGTCTEVYYIHYFGNSDYMYYLTFTGGDNLDSAKTKMLTNTNDSIIKSVIDEWYESDLINYTSYLENTIFCNDRSFASGSTGGPLSDKDTNSTSYSYFKSYESLMNGTPSLTCSNIDDRFSLKVDSGGTNGYGNNALTYPVGLLTLDEVMLAGGQRLSNRNYYLYTDEAYWFLSPGNCQYNQSYVYYIESSLYYNYTYGSIGVRPVVSLASGTEFEEGTGTISDPYVVKTS